jgi:two-component system, chemotaxis family, chemotaxis protein CheY
MKNVMIVDDSASIRKTVGFILHEEGYGVIEACNGRDALSKLNGELFDLIICDVNMPDMDGITFLKTIKNDALYSSYKFTPIIMLTTESCMDKKEEGRKAGAKAWILKPFRSDELLNAIKKLII